MELLVKLSGTSVCHSSADSLWTLNGFSPKTHCMVLVCAADSTQHPPLSSSVPSFLPTGSEGRLLCLVHIAELECVMGMNYPGTQGWWPSGDPSHL